MSPRYLALQDGDRDVQVKRTQFRLVPENKFVSQAASVSPHSFCVGFAALLQVSMGFVWFGWRCWWVRDLLLHSVSGNRLRPSEDGRM